MTVSSEYIFQPILLTDANCPEFVVHGTNERPWEDIKRSGGMKPMRRKHIHFATKLPEKMPPLDRYFQSRSKPKEDNDIVVSGMRSTSTVFIWVDVKKSLEGGVEWWRSENGVILTEGVGEPKMLGFEWVAWVEKRGTGEILFGEKVESAEVREMERRMERLGVGVGDGDEVDGKKVDGGQAAGEKKGGEKALRVEGAKGGEKPGPAAAAAVKDYWDD